MPHTIDMSVMLYNKDLYTKAGLDPEKPPTTLTEFADARPRRRQARRRHQRHLLRRQLRRLHRVHPVAVGLGRGRRRDERRGHRIDDRLARRWPTSSPLYRKLYDEGVAAPASKDEAGPTWLGALQSGKIGIAPGPSVWLGIIEEKGVKMGVAPITGINGGESTFVGGDSIGIGATSKQGRAGLGLPGLDHVGDEAQIEVIAKSKGVPTRTDLASNKYSSADPRIVTINNLMAKGKTPYAKNFNATYNDPQSPWIADVPRRAVRRRAEGPRRRQHRHHQVPATNDSLARPARRSGPGHRHGDDDDGAGRQRRPTALPSAPPRQETRQAVARRASTPRRPRSWWACSSSCRSVLVVWMSLHHWPLLGAPTLNVPENYAGLADNELLRSAVWFTLKYTVVITVLLFALAFGLALMVQHRRRGVGLLRTAFFLPVAVGFASASLLFLGLLSDEIGPVNELLAGLRRLRVLDQRQPEHARWARRWCWCCGASPGSTC